MRTKGGESSGLITGDSAFYLNILHHWALFRLRSIPDKTGLPSGSCEQSQETDTEHLVPVLQTPAYSPRIVPESLLTDGGRRKYSGPAIRIHRCAPPYVSAALRGSSSLLEAPPVSRHVMLCLRDIDAEHVVSLDLQLLYVSNVYCVILLYELVSQNTTYLST